jgi:hypothetical protein
MWKIGGLRVVSDASTTSIAYLVETVTIASDDSGSGHWREAGKGQMSRWTLHPDRVAQKASLEQYRGTCPREGIPVTASDSYGASGEQSVSVCQHFLLLRHELT